MRLPPAPHTPLSAVQLGTVAALGAPTGLPVGSRARAEHRRAGRSLGQDGQVEDGLAAGRGAALEFAAGLLRHDAIDAETFEMVRTRLVVAQSTADVASVVRALPSPVVRTEPERRMTEPLVLIAHGGALLKSSPWQLAVDTTVEARSARVVLDLGTAEFDGDEVDLEITCTRGLVELIVPASVSVNLERLTVDKGTIQDRLDNNAPLLGLPVVRVTGELATGVLRLRRPRTGLWGRIRGR